MAWTDEQFDAIYTNVLTDKDKVEGKSRTNVIVSAGAGSGKTAVLTERIVEMLEKGIDLDSLLVLTFTNAAAGEMKERVRKKLIERLNNRIDAIDKERNGGNDKDVIHRLEDERDKFVSTLNKVDSAKITTFDAYSLRLVKQYGYTLNIPSDISVIDSFYINSKALNELDKIMEEMYERNPMPLYKFFDRFPYKDDTRLKRAIMDVYKKVTLEIDTIKFLDEYVDGFYSEDNVFNVISRYSESIMRELSQYLDVLHELKDILIEEAELVNEFKIKAGPSIDLETFVDEFIDLLSDNRSYDEINDFFKKYPSIPAHKSVNKTQPDSLKEVKALIKEKKEILAKKIFKKEGSFQKRIAFLNESEIYDFIYQNKELTEFFIFVIKELYSRMLEFKRGKNAYEFMDIAKLAIEIVKNPKIGSEIRNSLSEILIDEYQDTSDIQEVFISHISNNNVYCVGDIKQGIYRFRNANPYIFKDKYENYKKGNGGYKIDLNKNFRSREEVLHDINVIFSEIMSLEFGDADYEKEHQMNFGLAPYNEGGYNGFNHNLEILEYSKDSGSEEFDSSENTSDEPDDKTSDDEKLIKDYEMESFIIADDILRRIEKKETRMVEEEYVEVRIVDGERKEEKKKRFVLKPLEYSDFCILIDRTTSFETIKKILEYKGIPVSINADISLNSDDITALIASLVKIVCLESREEYTKEYYHALASIGRSYISSLTDSEIFEIIMKSKGKDENGKKVFVKPFENYISNKAREIAKMIDTYSPYDVYQRIIEEFKVLEKLPLVGNVQDKMVITEYISGFVKNVSSLGESLYDIKDHLDKIISGDTPVKYSLDTKNDPGVKIMTIHKSKGLEFAVCYFPMLHKGFNDSDFKNSIGYYKESGFFFDYLEGCTDPLRSLGKSIIKNADISEKIRLFYVALTRAREKMVIIMQKKDNDNLLGMGSVNSFNDLLLLAKDKITPYIKEIDLSTLGITDEYKRPGKISQFNYGTKPKYKDESHLSDIISKDRISRETVEILSDSEQKNIDLGLDLHEILEFMDFKNPDFDSIKNRFHRSLIEKIVLTSPLFKNIKNAKTYHEYEFIASFDDKEYHGIIDLLAVYDDHIDIIDYKLANVDHIEYDRQLNIYRRYVESIMDLPVRCYLLSLKHNEYREVFKN